jgi:4-amino-4-deoxy-L-arabinose transferase-like glycosyltransferase
MEILKGKGTRDKGKGTRRFSPSPCLPLSVSVFLFAAALAIRLPYLTLIPRLTDETGEVLWALRIAQGEILPLTHVDTYNGPLFPYLLAAAFRVFGLSIPLPRAFVMVIGALTVVVTYGLARAMAGRLAGLLAGALMATSFTHVLINSHVAWSNCTTPFFTALAALVFYLAVMKGSERLLALSGLLIGLALQTHPSAFLLIPGLALWFLAQEQGRAWLRRPAPYVAVLLTLLAYSNMIWFNLRGGFASVAEARNPLNAYVEFPSLAAYAENVRNLIIQLLKMLSGTLAYTVRQGRSLPLALLSTTALLMPYVNRSYESLHDTRYIAFLLPLAYTAIGILLGDILCFGTPSATQHKQQGRGVTLWIAVLACLILIGTPLLSLGAYYRESMASGLSNEKLLHITVVLRDTRDRGGYVFIDKELKRLKLGGGGDPARAMDHLLAMDGTPHTLADLGKMNWFLDHDPDGDFMLILAPKTHAWLAERYRLVPLALAPTAEEPDPSTGSGHRYGLYDFEGRR